MPEPSFDLALLLFKYLQKTLLPEEQAKLDEWRNASEGNRRLFTTLTEQEFLSSGLEKLYGYDEDRGWSMISNATPLVGIDNQMDRNKTWFGRWKWYTVSAVAASLLVIFASNFLVVPPGLHKAAKPRSLSAKETRSNDVMPGGTKALLTLSDGTAIELDELNDGVVSQQGTVRVLKLNGRLHYKTSNAKGHAVSYNTISTPPGGEYQVELPDGSKVWLNATSSIRFPIFFGAHERRVELTGEAYFEVAQNKSVPFVVSVKGSEVHVTGTHFNVMAYDDEAVLKTTLLEGSVRFKKGGLDIGLRPGQQSELNNLGKIHVSSNVDGSEVLAWKNGFFYFQNAHLETVMRQVARWYNVEVEFRNKKSGELLHADIPRNTKLSQVLKALEIAGDVQFRIEGEKIIVM